ncbi:hypothetical protein AB0A69_19515 [Streptomyces sp. NPDC045431]|uniref:hypothetical protein n=1 Tax=Streptomyces sp. NPDC045431 TaxID=3155613 RepID=UPI00340AA5F0
MAASILSRPLPHLARRRSAPVALALAAVTLSGCAGTGAADSADGAGSGPIAIGAVTTVTSAEQLAFPLDAYELTPAQARQLQLAQDKLVAACMTARGFSWAAPQRPAPAGGNRHVRRYGVLDPAEAGRTGYHGPAQTGPGAKEREAGQDTSEAAQQAAGACVLEARARLNGKKSMDKADTTSDDYIERLVVEDAERAEQDPQVVKAFAKWSDCMSEAGHDYDDPWAANNDPEWGKSETATDTERRIATADVTCKVETNLAGVWLAVETAYQKRTLERNAKALAEVKKSNEDRMRRAADVLAKG